jgi:flagellar protein FlgJ
MQTIQGLTSDLRSLDGLRAKAASDPKGAAKEAAKAFETLFMQELMKSMRAATQASGMLDNEGSQLGTEMLDAQLASKMAGLPGGLWQSIARQLERQMGVGAPSDVRGAAAAPLPTIDAPLGRAMLGGPQRAALAFIERHQADAQAAQARSGIPASFMIAQAAHETGWGRAEIRHADGSPSFNLFGIKAGPGWRGQVADVTTTEYVDGVARKQREAFRAYGSYAEAFADYARLVGSQPRYREVMAQLHSAEGFAQGLQRAGYATDPAYAEKLTRVINTTLRLQRAAT